MSKTTYKIVELPIKKERLNNINPSNYDLPKQPPECVKDSKDFLDSKLIERIKNQPLPNDIEVSTITDYKNEIEYMVKILGVCKGPDVITELVKIVKRLHEKFNEKDVTVVSGFIDFIKHLHPHLSKKIDDLLLNGDETGWKPYYYRPISEIACQNTCQYIPDEHSVDLYNWGAAPTLLDNSINNNYTPYTNIPSYIRESLRYKLDSAIVEMINVSNFTTTKLLRRNVCFDAIYTTAPGTGANVPQVRPIEHGTTHGCSLNQDHYHGEERIIGKTLCKGISRHDLIYHLFSKHPKGYFVHLLVEFVTPILDSFKINELPTEMKLPLGIEETFPNKTPKDLSITVQNSGQPIPKSYKTINDDVIKPEVVEINAVEL